MERTYYIVEEVPSKYLASGTKDKLWYCHMKGYPNIPVFGSIGDKRKATAICKQYNLDGKARYA